MGVAPVGDLVLAKPAHGGLAFSLCADLWSAGAWRNPLAGWTYSPKMAFGAIKNARICTDLAPVKGLEVAGLVIELAPSTSHEIRGTLSQGRDNQAQRIR